MISAPCGKIEPVGQAQGGIAMASIISRNNRYCVVYSYVDEQGNRKQKWQTFKTLPEAKARKTEIEYNQQLGAFTIPNCTTVSELLTEYVSLYGKAKWSISAYTSNMSLIRHYIEPLLGSVKLKEITARTLEKYYSRRRQRRADSRPAQPDRRLLRTDDPAPAHRHPPRQRDHAARHFEKRLHPLRRHSHCQRRGTNRV